MSYMQVSLQKIYISPFLSEEDVECFTEYMELWLQQRRTEGLSEWISRALRIPGKKSIINDRGGSVFNLGICINSNNIQSVFMEFVISTSLWSCMVLLLFS